MQLDYPMRQRLIHQIVNRTGKALEYNDESVRRAILVVVAEEFSGSRLTVQERKRVVDQLFHVMRGLDVLQPLMDNPQITEIMVNGPEKIFVEINGCLEPVDIKFHDREHLAGVITNFFGCANRLIHEKKPLADMRLANGARVHAALPPAAPDGPVLTIRKFTGIRPDMAALIDSDFISEEAAEDLIRAVRERKSIFICGGTGSGKTTLLNILSGFIPPQERVVTIEDAAELNLQGLDNLVRLEARQPGPDGDGAIDLTDLVRASLRLRPDRIIVGEVRGREAYDMLQAMNTGHPGSLCTGHGNSCQDMIDRLALMILPAVQLPWPAVRGMIGAAIDILIHVDRLPTGKRQINEICLVQTDAGSRIILEDWYKRHQSGGLVKCENESYDRNKAL